MKLFHVKQLEGANKQMTKRTIFYSDGIEVQKVRYALRVNYIILGYSAIPWMTTSYWTQWFRTKDEEIVVLI